MIFMPSSITHGSDGDIAMETGIIPVIVNWLGREEDNSTKFLSNMAKEESGHPELIIELDIFAGFNLIFSLRRHHFSINVGDVDTGVQTGFVVCFDNVTAVNLAHIHTTVVGALSVRITARGPAVWPAVRTKKSVFLLQIKLKVLISMDLHQSCDFMMIVEFVE